MICRFFCKLSLSLSPLNSYGHHPFSTNTTLSLSLSSYYTLTIVTTLSLQWSPTSYSHHPHSITVHSLLSSSTLNNHHVFPTLTTSSLKSLSSLYNHQHLSRLNTYSLKSSSSLYIHHHLSKVTTFFSTVQISYPMIK